MSMIGRFREIMERNLNALLEKADDPEKMIALYLQKLKKDLGRIKSETATVMMEEQRAKRAVAECEETIAKMERYAVKATESGNERDARRFLEKKTALSAQLAELQEAYHLAAANSQKMKQMHDKLAAEISAVEAAQDDTF